MELPETSLLVALEAVVRQRSFRRAADELHLSASAISHRIKTLETQVGQPLLIRTTRTVEPTPAGASLVTTVASVLDDLRTACRLLQSRTPVVTVVTTDSVATCWLIDRLPAIANGIDVEIRVLTRPAGFSYDPTVAEFAIAYGRPEHWPSGQPLLLAREAITPVCNRGVASTITAVDDLWRHPLLADQNLAIDWPMFARRVGCDPATVQGIRPTAAFNHSHLALRAAASGQGIALAGSPLADDAIARGELVTPIAEAVVTGNGYYLVASELRSTPETQQIRHAFAQQAPPKLEAHA